MGEGEIETEKKQKKNYPTIHTAVYAKKDQKMKKKFFPVICRSVPVDIEPPFGLVRMFFDMSLTNSRKGCMTMVKVKYDKKVDCMQNYAKQSVKKSIKESSNVQRRVFLIQLEIGHWRGRLIGSVTNDLDSILECQGQQVGVIIRRIVRVRSVVRLGRASVVSMIVCSTISLRS